MLLPVGHEKNTVSRLPIVTIILLMANVFVFLLTTREINNPDQSKSIVTVRTHILILKARYPDLNVAPEAQQMIEEVRKEHPAAWNWLTANDRRPEDAWEAAHLMDPDPRPDRLQAEMDELCAEFKRLETSDSSLLWKYAYHSYKPSPISYISHQFLHGGWLHLIGNMWMLYLCGVVLEDVWGPFVVLIFYLVAGACAATVHGLMTPGSLIPMVGASGSVAGLMGAMLARFPKLKIKIAYMYLFFLRFRAGTFMAPVYIVAPLWFFAELLYGLLGERGVAHWAHVGGFLFGTVIGLAFYAVKIESVVNKEDPGETWVVDEQLMHATDLLEQRNVDACMTEIRSYLQQKPNSIEGWQLLLRAQDWKAEYQAERDETLPQLIRLCLAAGDTQQANQYIEQYRATGGKQLPAATWMEVCRNYEREQNWEQAAQEYEQLGRAFYVTDRVSLNALMSAARITLGKLNRPAAAESLYQAVENSPLPHLDLEELIRQGLKQCATAKFPAGSATVAQ